MLEEAVAALLADKGLDPWTTKVIPATSKYVESWIVLHDGAGQVRAKAWFEERANGIHLMFRTSGRNGTASSKILRDGWDPNVGLAVAVGLAAATGLPDEALISLVNKKDLTPDGRIPAARCVRKVVRRILSDLKLDPDMSVVVAACPPAVVDMVSHLSKQFDEVPGKRVKKALGQARFAVRDLLKLGVPFQSLKDLWDEETVRSVQES